MCAKINPKTGKMQNNNQCELLLKMTIQHKTMFVFACIMMSCAIVLDAMGAHALSKFLNQQQLSIWSIAGRYLLIQSLALLVLSLLSESKILNISLKMITFGVLAFSLSLYTLCFIQIPYLGLLTPIGGVSMLMGWLGVILSVIKK
ncbi:DUF423 domain-containing protein [Marinicellulosiphila megalodicopiae]|uniref:DUF423 domain-containing protein n=1 Tax=Marinicellulosiphila megalodicopiae TaxID=2724896 RepID=UPI003BB19DE4